MTERLSSPDGICPSRRDLLRSLAAVGVGTIASGVLVACGSGTEPSPAPTSEVDPPPPSTSDAGEADPGPTPLTVVAQASQVPEGQALVVDVGGQRIVVAKPSAGSFVAFSTTCTHQGTPVNVLGGLELACPNHGSRFSAADGSVSRGPATSPLASVAVRLEGDQVVLT